MTEIQTAFPYKTRVIENIYIPMPDGIRLAARLWLPEGAGPCPALLEYLPYRKRDGTRTRDDGLHAYVAAHGYACLRLDIRGSGDSEGLIDDEYTPQEQRDGVDAIAWIAAQGWCDGQVSMIGISWGGFNGLQIAALQPPALRSVITLGSTDDRYATDIHWIGGCLSKDNFDWSSTMLASNDLPPDPAIAGPGWRAMWQARLEHNRPWITGWLRHQRRDAFWQQGSVCEDFSAIKVPVYAVSGWADNYSEAIPRMLAGLSCRRLGLIGPWAHSYPHDVTVAPAIGWLQELVRWLDHWSKGRDTGMMDQPMLRVWMQEHVPPQTCYDDRPGRWVAEAAWPSPRILPQTYHLNPGQTLAPEAAAPEATAAPAIAAPATATLCSPLWVGLGAGEVGRYGGDAEWPGDQREDDGGGLVFLTAPLPSRVEILGAPSVQITFTSDKPQALICARLNDVAPDGRSTRVTLGLLNLSHRDSHEHPTPLVPGTTYSATIEMDDIAHAFPAGHRIAVALSTSYWPIAWPSPELASLTLMLGDSRLTLPVRPEDPADAYLAPFGPAVSAANTPATYLAVENPIRRQISRDLLSGKMTVDFPRWTYAKHMPDIAQTQTSQGHVRFEITDGDPLSARTSTDYRMELQFPETTVAHHSWGSLSCDASHFIVEMDLEVSENGTVFFRRHWLDKIARDMM